MGGGVNCAGFDASYFEVRTTAIVRDAAGGLVVGGAGLRGGVNVLNEDFVLARLDTDGLVDPTWGNASTSGTAFVQFDLIVDGDDYLSTLLALPGGGILAEGDAQYAASDRDLAFARFDARAGCSSCVSLCPTCCAPSGPDDVKGERIKAFVVLKPGEAPGPGLIGSLKDHVRQDLGPIAQPSDIEIRTVLPKTRSGKIVRRFLKAQELGEDPGDLSTLAD